MDIEWFSYYLLARIVGLYGMGKASLIQQWRMVRWFGRGYLRVWGQRVVDGKEN
jgi:hypothetical protein